MPEFNLLAACAFGLEAVVKRELQSLGLDARGVQPGKIGFQGDWNAVAKANLWLRSADRILIEVDRFDAPDFDALFDTTKAIDWSRYLPQDAKFPVDGRSRNSQLTSVPAVQRSVKRAVVESLKDAYRGELPETGPEYKLEIALLNDEAALTIDTTGPSLHKRGYRKLVGPAPLKESLAAAMIQLSVWNSNRPLIDPFCGSGTIPIEAALIGLNIAPGLHRQFSFEHWPEVPEGVARQARVEAMDVQDRKTSLQIVGTDRDGEVLSLARYHAGRAGVEEQIHFQEKSFDQLRSKREYGVLIANPPYGERLENESNEELMSLYKSIPQILQRLPTWSHYVLTSLADFEKVVQSRATRRRKLYNGRIECTFYQYLGPRPPKDFAQPEIAREIAQSTDQTKSPLTIPGDAKVEQTQSESPWEAAVRKSRQQKESQKKSSVAEPPKSAQRKETKKSERAQAVFGALQDKDYEQSELFARRLKKLSRHLRRWPTKRGITCYRIYERDIPELPFIVDRYEDFLHITEYERPHERDLGRHAAWLELMKKTASSALEIPIQRVILKSREKREDKSQYSRIDQKQKTITVNEGGLKLLVNLTDYVDTGLFLDHRNTRSMVRDEAEGKRFLNLFAYTGSFSVYAAAGGAKLSVTVDASRHYIQWAKNNLEENGLSGPQHQFVVSDTMEYLINLPTEPLFDLAVVDPPTFSNSKDKEADWDVQTMHVELLQEVRKRMSKSGVVYFSTNFRRFKLDEFGLAGFTIREISKQTVPEDYRNRRIHRCWRLVVCQT